MTRSPVGPPYPYTEVDRSVYAAVLSIRRATERNVTSREELVDMIRSIDYFCEVAKGKLKSEGVRRDER